MVLDVLFEISVRWVRVGVRFLLVGVSLCDSGSRVAQDFNFASGGVSHLSFGGGCGAQGQDG